MEKQCLHCAKLFNATREDAQFCSPACRKAHNRKEKASHNLTWQGIVIRGQHSYDLPVTGQGIIRDKCRFCGQGFSRWIESKLARLVRNEVEGSVHWENRDFNREMFDKLMAIRRTEVHFCSDECMMAYGREASPGGEPYLNAPLQGELYTAEGDEISLSSGILRVRRRVGDKVHKDVGDNGQAKDHPRHRGQI